jgi:two-component system cell cycle sensor histidine kinase/response regulator CckA
VPTILVVDDEPVIGRLMKIVLEEQGFQVLNAQSGPDALHVSATHPGEIDLLLSDITMPGMDGPTLAKRMHATDPNLPVVFVSAYSEPGQQDEVKPFPILAKPFSLSALLRTVRSTLRSRR